MPKSHFHFVSIAAAAAYYLPTCDSYQEAHQLARRKVDDGEIAIGEPPHSPDDTLYVQGGRYAIVKGAPKNLEPAKQEFPQSDWIGVKPEFREVYKALFEIHKLADAPLLPEMYLKTLDKIQEIAEEQLQILMQSTLAQSNH